MGGMRMGRDHPMGSGVLFGAVTALWNQIEVAMARHWKYQMPLHLYIENVATGNFIVGGFCHNKNKIKSAH